MAKKNIIRVLTGLLVLVIAFHFLILVKIIPFNIAWGGWLKSEQEMYMFESISITLNLFLIWILSLKAKNVKRKFIDITLWIFFVIFSLNTIGNLFAHTNFEKYFSILTLIFALLLLKILWKKNDEQNEARKTNKQLTKNKY
jgi:hypothetical protein